MGAKEGRSCKGATGQRHEDRPEKRGHQKGGEEAGHDDWTGCGVTCRLRESDGVRSLVFRGRARTPCQLILRRVERWAGLFGPAGRGGELPHGANSAPATRTTSLNRPPTLEILPRISGDRDQGYESGEYYPGCPRIYALGPSHGDESSRSTVPFRPHRTLSPASSRLSAKDKVHRFGIENAVQNEECLLCCGLCQKDTRFEIRAESIGGQIRGTEQK